MTEELISFKILVNRVYYEIQASPPPVVAEDWGVFVHFDANGRLIALYSSTSSRPTDISLLSDSLAYNPSNLIRMYVMIGLFCDSKVFANYLLQ